MNEVRVIQKNTNNEYQGEYYENNEPPILSAFTIDEIYNRLVEVFKMTAEQRLQLGKAQQAFVYKWHNFENTIDMYITALEKIVEEVSQKKNQIH